MICGKLFRKLCTRFHQNHLSFIEDITKKLVFFPDMLGYHVVMSYNALYTFGQEKILRVA